MSDRDLLIFTAIGTTVILGITGVGWFYFVRWYKEEEKSGRKHIDAHLAEIVSEPGPDSEN